MTPERLAEIEQALASKLFPHGGFDEVRELIEAVKTMRREIGNLRKALFSGENDDGTVDLSLAAHVALLKDPWARRRYARIRDVQIARMEEGKQ